MNVDVSAVVMHRYDGHVWCSHRWALSCGVGWMCQCCVLCSTYGATIECLRLWLSSSLVTAMRVLRNLLFLQVWVFLVKRWCHLAKAFPCHVATSVINR